MSWVEKIEGADVLVAIADDRFFACAKCFLVVQEAMRLKIPLRVLLWKKAEVPKGYFNNYTDLKTQRIDARDQVGPGMFQLMEGRRPDSFVKLLMVDVEGLAQYNREHVPPRNT